MSASDDPKKPKKIISIACRVSGDRCEGRQSELVWKKPLPMGGASYRYRCLSCMKTWFISV